jgi:hypothetical protein
MNEELLAASALLVQSGAILVSVKIGVRFAKSSAWLAVCRQKLQLSNVKPIQVNNGGTSKRIETSIHPLKRPTDY